MAHGWREAVVEMFGHEEVMYAVCYVTGDTGDTGHGLPDGTEVIIAADYEDDDWFDPYDYYSLGMCCERCDRNASLPPWNEMPTLGVVTLEEWHRLAGSGIPLDVRLISDADLGGLGEGIPRTVPEIDGFDIGDRVWRVACDGIPNMTDTGTVTDIGERWDYLVIWDSAPEHVSPHPVDTLTYALLPRSVS